MALRITYIHTDKIQTKPIYSRVRSNDKEINKKNNKKIKKEKKTKKIKLYYHNIYTYIQMNQKDDEDD